MEEARRIDDEGSKQAAALKKKTEDVWRVSEGLDNFTGGPDAGPPSDHPLYPGTSGKSEAQLFRLVPMAYNGL